MIRWINRNQPVSHAIPIQNTILRSENSGQNASRIYLRFVDFLGAHGFTRRIFSFETDSNETRIKVHVEIVAVAPHRVAGVVGHIFVPHYPVYTAEPVNYVVIKAMLACIFEERPGYTVER